MDRPRVLVVEDRPSVLKLMATVLESAYDVTTAADGEAALALVGAEPFDVVLTDIRMPGTNGLEVLLAVLRRAPGTPVVLMTAYANVPDAVTAIKLGAFDYVAKPLDADEIALVVARAVEHRHEDVEASQHAATDRARAPVPGEDPEVSVGFHRAVEEARERASRSYLVRLMGLFHGNVTQAARRAGMTRESLHRVLRKYGVQYEHRGPAAAGEHRPREETAPPEAGGGRG